MYKLNKVNLFFKIISIVVFLTASSFVSAQTFFKTGKITRIITQDNKTGGCMIKLSNNIGNGCPANGFVSLDCNGDISADASKGKRAYATALLAYSMGKKVSVRVDNQKVLNSFCVADRLDIL